jgi:ribonuclease R
MEQIAANAERASVKYKEVEYMSERIGNVYDGVISGVTEWGLYVEINENKCEGMIPIRDLDDDYYEFDDKNYCIRGRRKHHVYSLGAPVTIKVERANLEKKQLDFVLVSDKSQMPIDHSMDKPAHWEIRKDKKKDKKDKKERKDRKRRR